MQRTARALLDSDPPWMSRAFGEMGQHEVTGPDHNPSIVKYHSHTTLTATDDETPWCSSFLCWVFEESQIASTQSAASLSWLRWGREIEYPRRGCVVVFERLAEDGSVIPNRGHCALWLGQDYAQTIVLGGNQSDRVGINAYPLSQVVGYRWPSLPYNSTTNIASAGVGVATIATAAPPMLEVLDRLSENKDTVDSLLGRAKELLTVLVSDAGASLSLIGAGVALAGVWWIIRERNKKMRKWGV